MYFGASTLQFRFLKLFVFEVAALRLLSELDVLAFGLLVMTVVFHPRDPGSNPRGIFCFVFLLLVVDLAVRWRRFVF